MIINYRKAEKADLENLKRLWTEVFEEEHQAVELFFIRNKNNLHGYLAEAENMPVAAVYLLDCTLNGNKSNYLCGAATKLGYRRRGIMARLIEYSLADAKNRGDRFSLLYPANEGLYAYYEKLGYLRKCSIKSRLHSRAELEAIPFDGEICEGTPDFEALQKSCFKNNFLLQNNSFMDFAVKYYAVYGVKNVMSKNSFALYEEENGTAVVLYAIYNDFKELKSLLLQKTNAESFVFYGNACNPVLQDGIHEQSGMIKPLDRTKAPEDIYIGITLN